MMNKKNSFIFFKVFLKAFKVIPYSCLIILLRNLVAAAVPSVIIFVTAKMFDNAAILLKGQNVLYTLIGYAIVYFLIYFLIDQISQFANMAISKRLYEYCGSLYRIELANKTTRLQLINFEDAEVENSRIRAKDCIDRQTMAELFMEFIYFISSVLSVILVVAVLARYSLWFVPISLISVIPYLIMRIARGREFYYIKYGQAKEARKLEYLWSLFNKGQTVKEMRVMGFDTYLTDMWKDTKDNVNEELWRFNVKDQKSMLFCDGIRILGYVGSLVLSLVLAVQGNLSIGVYCACIAAFSMVQEQTMSLFMHFGRIPELVMFNKVFFSYLNLPEEKKGTLSFHGITDKLEAQGLSFRYPNAKRITVNDVSFTIKKGEKVVILGENGSGKTTLSKLILGLYNAQEGSILYDGVNFTQIDKDSFYKKVSIVSQNYTPYHLTLRENVALSNIDIIDNNEQIEKALKEVELEGLIQNAEGLDSQLGREFGGIDLSGGQWQKLAIARCLFKRSEFVVMDEPTSALDPLIETEILSKFLDIAKDKTTVIISHRVGLCKFVDRIFVMKDGVIVEAGSHEELIKKNGEYKRLYSMQEQWYL